MTDSAVLKTAYDALMSKKSALDAGYEPVDRNFEVYRNLLNKIVCSNGRSGPRRQTPLVNAGYAVRIAIVTHAVNRFIEYHSKRNRNTVQLVCLGCGLDVVGLWAHSLSPSTVRIFEVDTKEICNEKRAILLSNDLVKSFDESSLDNGAVLAGRVSTACEDETNTSNYTLLTCDLRYSDQVKMAFSTLDSSVPTLILSELVLAYLGRSGVDGILDLCASTVCCASDSAFVAYEPLGEGTGTGAVEAYKQEYCQLFREKLQRGSALTCPGKVSEGEGEMFHPFGSSPESVESRMQTAGFPTAYASLVGKAALHAASCHGGLVSPEPFDEHAAFTLHMSSYVLACGFSRGTEKNLTSCMCPWSIISIFPMPIQGMLDQIPGISIDLVEAGDQMQVKELFSETYQELAHKYPAVRKLVKTALKTDLRFSTDTNALNIGFTYKTNGGIFIVAAEDATNSEQRRHVVGCVGLRRCHIDEGRNRGSRGIETFEIHRLAVDSSARGRGIGRALLDTLDRFASWKVDSDEFRIVATTPALLLPANQLYHSCGYRLVKEESMGGLTMNTYLKERKL
jgi:ribosomal protein S18 acetylase RimI-like enzyme/O-methyltransferase involved in polyketide biosynthesis